MTYWVTPLTIDANKNWVNADIEKIIEKNFTKTEYDYFDGPLYRFSIESKSGKRAEISLAFDDPKGYELCNESCKTIGNLLNCYLADDEKCYEIYDLVRLLCTEDCFGDSQGQFMMNHHELYSYLCEIFDEEHIFKLTPDIALRYDTKYGWGWDT